MDVLLPSESNLSRDWCSATPAARSAAQQILRYGIIITVLRRLLHVVVLWQLLLDRYLKAAT
jgi:hypothetical protein